MAANAGAFDVWFAGAMGNPARTPFPYQRALAEAEVLPELLEVPTGTGKTAAAILAWLWRRRQRRDQTPRRLVYCLPMRVLVEQTRANAIRWLRNLDRLAGHATFDGERLSRYEVDWTARDRVAVVTLMGGEQKVATRHCSTCGVQVFTSGCTVHPEVALRSIQQDWRAHPEREAIIVGTQDMLLSRALNRGYAMPPQEWPIDFGLLNVDALWVMDEVQLMGPARTTSVQLQHFWDQGPRPFGSRRTVWMSATLGSSVGSIELPAWMRTPERANSTLFTAPHNHTAEDLRHVEFQARWTAPKKLEARFERTSAIAAPAAAKKKRPQLEPTSSWTVWNDELLSRIVHEAAALRGYPACAQDSRLVLVFMNQVKRARELNLRLRRRLEDSQPRPEVLIVHARLRPRDRREVEHALQTPAPSAGRIVITTQVLEAGVDLDADVIFTEMCPRSSLIQRLGRLNRSGRRPHTDEVAAGTRAPAIAIVFEPPLRDLPKRDQETEAQHQERRRADASLPYEPAALDDTREHLRRVDAEHAGSLSPETLARLPVSLPVEGPVLRRFDLDDLFDTDPDLSGGHIDVAPLLRAADREIDAYVLWRRIVQGLDPDEQVPLHREELCPVPFYEAREALAADTVWILTLATGRRSRAAWREATGRDIRAGDTVMIDVGVGGYAENDGWTPGAHALRPSSVVDRWQMGDGLRVRAWITVDTSATPTLLEEIDGHVVGARARDQDPRSFGREWMELEAHLEAAAAAAGDLARELVPEPSRSSLILAARWHDVGKALEREVAGELRRPFQHMLLTAGAPERDHPPSNLLYAKSNRRGGTPAGFRHEVASLLAFLRSSVSDDLAAFLIVAHHGKVRMLPAAWDEAQSNDACGVRLGDRIPGSAIPGMQVEPIALEPERLLPSTAWRGWQGRVAGLLHEHGPFALAYLEALVRIADWRAS